MVFSRIFGKNEPAPSPEPAEPEETDAPEDGDVPEGDTEDSDPHWAARAGGLIPGGASTASKRPDKLFADPDGMPTHFVRAAGCHLFTSDGETILDCTMALGSVALGYAEP